MFFLLMFYLQYRCIMSRLFFQLFVNKQENYTSARKKCSKWGSRGCLNSLDPVNYLYVSFSLGHCVLVRCFRFIKDDMNFLELFSLLTTSATFFLGQLTLDLDSTPSPYRSTASFVALLINILFGVIAAYYLSKLLYVDRGWYMEKISDACLCRCMKCCPCAKDKEGLGELIPERVRIHSSRHALF